MFNVFLFGLGALDHIVVLLGLAFVGKNSVELILVPLALCLHMGIGFQQQNTK